MLQQWWFLCVKCCHQKCYSACADCEKKGKTRKKLYSKWKQVDKEKWQGNKTGTKLSIATFLSDFEKLSELQRCSLLVLWVWQNLHWWTVGCGKNGRTVRLFLPVASLAINQLVFSLFAFFPRDWNVCFQNCSLLFCNLPLDICRNNMVILFPVSFLKKTRSFNRISTTPFWGESLTPLQYLLVCSLCAYFHFVTGVDSFTGNWWDPINNDFCLNS